MIELSSEELARLADDCLTSLVLGDPISDDVQNWLKNGVQAILDGKDVRVALGIKRCHGKRAESAVPKVERDHLICELVSSLDPDNKRRTTTAKKVASILGGKEAPPPELEDLASYAKSFGAVGARQIARIVSEKNTPSDDCIETLNRVFCHRSGGR